MSSSRLRGPEPLARHLGIKGFMNVAVLMLHGSGFLITPLAPWHFTMLVDVGLRLDGGMTYTDDWLIDIFITFQELKHTLP